MRNRKNEAFGKIDLLLKISTEFTDRAVKTKSNVEFETYIKCAELVQSYASDIMKDEIDYED